MATVGQLVDVFYDAAKALERDAELVEITDDSQLPAGMTWEMLEHEIDFENRSRWEDAYNAELPTEFGSDASSADILAGARAMHKVLKFALDQYDSDSDILGIAAVARSISFALRLL